MREEAGVKERGGQDEIVYLYLDEIGLILKKKKKNLKAGINAILRRVSRLRAISYYIFSFISFFFFFFRRVLSS